MSIDILFKNNSFLNLHLSDSDTHDFADSNESDLLEHVEDAASPLTSIKQNNSNVIADNEVNAKLLCNVNEFVNVYHKEQLILI